MKFNRWDVIQVYDRREVDGILWYMVGPDQWIARRGINDNIVGQSIVSLVYVDSPPPADVDNGRWVEINLYEQTVSVYNNNQLVYAMLVSSGAEGFWTRPGLFQIHDTYETTPMTGSLRPTAPIITISKMCPGRFTLMRHALSMGLIGTITLAT